MKKLVFRELVPETMVSLPHGRGSDKYFIIDVSGDPCPETMPV